MFLDSNVLGQEDLVGERELRGGSSFLRLFLLLTFLPHYGNLPLQ